MHSVWKKKGEAFKLKSSIPNVMPENYVVGLFQFRNTEARHKQRAKTELGLPSKARILSKNKY